jgi:hypothetical protein
VIAMKKSEKRKTATNRATKKAAAKRVPMNEKALREQLGKFVDWGKAHANWKAALEGVGPEQRGVRPPNSPHSLWELLEHTRLGQWDIVEFCRDAKHVSPDWPKGYWPESPAPADDAAWDKCVKSFFKDMKDVAALATDSKIDLLAPIPHGTGQTILQELLLVADHNAYHLGQFVLVRRLLGSWRER